MAVTILNEQISVLSPSLTMLAARKYSKSHTPVPNGKLPTGLRTVLSKVYSVLTGTELQLGDMSIAVDADKTSGGFNRLYAPKVYRGGTAADGTVTPELYIRWGEERIPLEFEEGLLSATSPDQCGGSVKFKFTKFNPSGRGDDPGLEVKVTEKSGSNSTVYQTTIAIAPVDWKSYDPGTFETLLETDAEAFKALFTQEGTAGGGKSSGEITDFKAICIALFGGRDEQTRPVTLTVTGYRPVVTSYGASFVMQCAASTDAELVARMPFTAVEFSLWADRNSKMILGSGPVITDDKPATYVIAPKSLPSLLVERAASKAGELDLDFD